MIPPRGCECDGEEMETSDPHPKVWACNVEYVDLKVVFEEFSC